MYRSTTTLLLSLGLVALPGCFNKDKGDTQNPDEAAAGGADGGSATTPSRATQGIETGTRLSRDGGRIKTFETPKDVRTEVVVALPPESGVDLSVSEVRPSMAAAGSQVEIFGSGFVAEAADNKVSSGGTAWEVVAVYGDRLVAKVPAGAPSGNISVAAGVGKGSTSNSFTALGGDAAFEQAVDDLHGLVGTVYALDAEAEGLPDFGSLSASGTIALANFDIAPTPASDFESDLGNYAIRFSGSLSVDGEGEYNLCLNSDDGSRLLLMDTLVVEVDGVHEATEGCELVYLEAGEYDVVIEYFNAASTPNAALQFTWDKDGSGKAAVPASAFFRP